MLRMTYREYLSDVAVIVGILACVAFFSWLLITVALSYERRNDLVKAEARRHYYSKYNSNGLLGLHPDQYAQEMEAVIRHTPDIAIAWLVDARRRLMDAGLAGA